MARLIILLHLLLSGATIAQTNGTIQAPASANGRSCLDKTCSLQNPARTISIQKTTVALAVSPSRFGMPEISPASLLIGHPFGKNIVGGASLYAIGNHLYNEYSFGGFSSFRIDDMFIVGISVRYSGIGIKNHGSDGALLIDAGGVMHIADWIDAGFSFGNITGAAYEGGDNTTMRRALFGFSFKVEEYLFFDLDGIVLLNNSSGFALAGAWFPADYLGFRLAYCSNPESAEGGAMIQVLPFLEINCSLNYHNYLGFSQTAGMALEF